MRCALAIAWCAATAVSAAAAPANGPLTVSDERLSAQVQRQLALRAVDICSSRGAKVAVAIAGPDRVVRTVLSHDQASTIAVETARRKAISAALVGYPTSGLTKAAQEAPAYAEMLRSIEPQLIIIGGGVPIRVGSLPLGGLGVGGAAGPEADEACANEAIGQVLRDAAK